MDFLGAGFTIGVALGVPSLAVDCRDSGFCLVRSICNNWNPFGHCSLSTMQQTFPYLLASVKSIYSQMHEL